MNKNLYPLELAKQLSKRVTQMKRTVPRKETQLRTTSTEEKDEEEHPNSTQNPLEDTELSVLISTITGDMDNGTWINSRSTTATAIQAEINQEKEILPLEKQIPEEFHEYLDVFSEEKLEVARFPEPRTWDHKIKMKDTFVPKSFKTYNLTPQKQIELDKFLKDNLDKGYIQPSQSPMDPLSSL